MSVASKSLALAAGGTAISCEIALGEEKRSESGISIVIMESFDKPFRGVLQRLCSECVRSVSDGVPDTLLRSCLSEVSNLFSQYLLEVCACCMIINLSSISQHIVLCTSKLIASRATYVLKETEIIRETMI